MTSHADDDRALLLTAPGTAALAVVRLVGPGVGPFLRRRFSRPVWVERVAHGLLRDEQGRTLDDPVVVLIDTYKADVTLHGGRWVVQSVLDLAARDGFAVVSADGEAHATDANATDAHATDAHALEDEIFGSLPTAATPTVVRMLLSQPAAWHDLSRRSDVDAYRAVLVDRSGWWLTHPPTVAIVGPPNVGKSTLANRLFGQQRSITADAPGTTRDWVGGLADLGGLAVQLVDTPGVRRTHDPIEVAAIASAGDVVRSADLTVLVLDRSRPLDADARAMLADHPTAVRVANKADAPPAWEDGDAIHTAATTGVGTGEVAAAVRRHFCCEPIDPLRPRWWTDRQRDRLDGIVAKMG